MALPELPDYTGDDGPSKRKAINHVSYCRSTTPKAGRGIRIDRAPGGSVISTTLPEGVRLAKATAAIAAPTWSTPNLTAPSGSITFLKPSGANWTLGSETGTAYNVMVGSASVANGDLVVVSWCDGRWVIVYGEC